MRVLIVDRFYDSFLRGHYGDRAGLAARSYDAQWASLMGVLFGTADSYSHHLTQLGHPSHEVVLNCVPLQQAWMREHYRLRWLPRRFRRNLVEDQADWYGADVIYVQDLFALAPAVLERLRKRGALVVGQIASPPPPADVLVHYDLLVSSLPHFVEQFQAIGVASEYLPLAFDRRVLDRLNAVGPADVVFVGNLNPLLHGEGNGMIARAAERVGVDVWGFGADGLDSDSPLLRRYHGEAWGIDMYSVFAAARVVLNRHGNLARDAANNMRLFEATGVGSLLLTDEKRNLHELFVPGGEVVTYASDEDLVEKACHYLAHEDERAAIASAGQARTLADHTYDRRMAELVAILDRYRR